MLACRDAGGVSADPIHVKWARPRPAARTSRTATPAMDERAAYVAEQSGLSSLDANTGAQLWHADLPGVGAASAERLLVDDGRVYVTTWRAVALDKGTGRVVWDVPLESSAELSENAVSDGVLYLGSRNHRVYALDAATGATRWMTNLSEGSPFEGLVKGIARSGDTLFVAVTAFLNQSGGQRRGVVAALNRHTGAVLWRYETPDSSSGADATPALAPTVVIVGNITGGETFALDRSTGLLRWRSPALAGRFGPSAPALVVGDRTYIGSNDAVVYALVSSTGQELWRQSRGSAISAIAACGRSLLVLHLEAAALERDSGSVLPSPSLDGIGLAASDFAVLGRTAVVVGERQVYSLACPE